MLIRYLKRRLDFQKLRASVRRILLNNPSLFESEFYYQKYLSGIKDIDFLDHFMEQGLNKNYSPNPLFDPEWYLKQVPEATEVAGGAFAHYIIIGFRDFISPHPLIDPNYYNEQINANYGQVTEPITHYLKLGASEGLNPNPFFSTRWYEEIHKKHIPMDVNPLVHYVKEGEVKNLAPSPLFDVSWYNLQRNHDGGGALTHYMRFGRQHGFSPHPFFDYKWYSESRPDVVASRQPMAEHYLAFGEAEGSQPNPFFNPGWYLKTYDDVLLSGLSALEHYAAFGSSEGRDPGPGFSAKAYLRVNPDVSGFHGGPLAHYIQYGIGEGRSLGLEDPIYYTTNSAESIPVDKGEPRILIVDSTYPTPDRDSGSQDAVNFISIFQMLGFRTYFIATSEFHEIGLQDSSREARDRLSLNGTIILDSKHGQSPAEIIRLNGGYFRLFFLSRIYCGGEVYESVRAHAPRSKIIFNTVDLHHLREEREAKLRNSLGSLVKSYATAERELYLARQCDATIVVSSTEKLAILERSPGSNVFLVPLIRGTTNHVEAFEARSGIVFIGGFGHPPNVDALRYLLDTIWPIIRRQLPSASLMIVGPYLPADISERKDDGIRIMGHISDLDSIFSQVRLSVAPLRYGAGAKGKIATSLSYGVPCVATSIAAEGMNLEQSAAIATADDPEEFASRVVSVYSDKDLWLRLSNSGITLMRSRHSIAVGKGIIEEILVDISVPSAWPN